MIIDMHTHAFPDRIASRACEALERDWGSPASFDCSIGGLLRATQAAGVSLAVVQPVATDHRQVQPTNQWAAGVRSQRVEAFAAWHPDVDDPLRRLELIAEQGFRGIKLHPGHQRFRPSEERLRPAFRTAARLGLMVFTCAGRDEVNDVVQSEPAEWAEIVDEHPGLRLIVAHMGGYDQWDAVRRDLAGRSVYLETSYVLTPLGGLNAIDFVSLVRAHGPHRVVFGTDAPLADIGREVRRTADLPWSDAERTAIMGGTASRLLRMAGAHRMRGQSP